MERKENQTTQDAAHNGYYASNGPIDRAILLARLILGGFKLTTQQNDAPHLDIPRAGPSFGATTWCEV